MEPVDPHLRIEADPQLLASAVTNLLNNAFKYTLDDGHVTLRAGAGSAHLRIEVEDECGGLPEPVVDPSKPSSERRGRQRSGLGLDSPKRAKPLKPRAVTFRRATFGARAVSLSSRAPSFLTS
jgi:hypothetical protein